MWRTMNGLFTRISALKPPKPLPSEAMGWSWMELICSTWIQPGQELVKGQAAPPAFSLRAVSSSSRQVVGGFSGSSPARRNASLFQYITAVELLNGIDICRPSLVWK